MDNNNNLKRIDIKAGYDCNNNCIFCVLGDLRKHFADKTTAEIKKDIDSAKNKGFEKIVLTGGEITIRKDFFDILKYADSLDLKKIHIESNGRMFCYEDFAKKTAEYADSFSISLHAFDEKSYDILTNTKKGFEQVILGLKNLKKDCDDIHINSTITKLNYRDLEKGIEILKDLGIKQINFPFVNPEGNAFLNKEKVVPKISEAAHYIRKAMDLASKNDIKSSTEMIPYCFLKGYEKHAIELYDKKMSINSPGHKNYDFQETRKKGKIKSEKCAECKYNNFCEGIMKNYADLFGLDELKPIIEKKVSKEDLING